MTHTPTVVDDTLYPEYEEKVVMETLCYRLSPGHPWVPVAYTTLLQRYLMCKKERDAVYKTKEEPMSQPTWLKETKRDLTYWAFFIVGGTALSALILWIWG